MTGVPPPLCCNRGSKLLDVGRDPDTLLSPLSSQSMESLPTVTSTRAPPSSPCARPREQAPPCESSVLVTVAECDTTLDLRSFEDENGEPCSAV